MKQEINEYDINNKDNGEDIKESNKQKQSKEYKDDNDNMNNNNMRL